MTKSDDIKVFISNRDSICDECKEQLGSRAWITLERNKGAMGYDRWEARDQVNARVGEILTNWET